MRVLALAYFLLTVLGVGLLAASPAHADRKVRKTVNIDRQAIDRALGNEVVSGEVTKVGHEVIYIETEGERTKVDLDDISFPDRIDEIIYKGDRVVVTGIKKDDSMTASRIVIIRDGIRRTFISKKPVDIKIKGNEDVTIRITP